MKKIIVIAVALLLAFSACNKNKDEKLNKKLNGSWLATDQSVKYTFSESGSDQGNVTATYFFSNNTVNKEFKGTYKINKDGKTLIIDATQTVFETLYRSASSATIHIIDVIFIKSKSKIELEEDVFYDPDGCVNVYILEKQ